MSPQRFSEADFRPDEPAARQRRPVDVAGIALPALVEIRLVGVEEILHAGVELQGERSEDREFVGQFDVQREEVGRGDCHVDRRARTCGVLDEHLSGVGARQRDVEPLHGDEVGCQVAVPVGRTEHAAFVGRVVAPMLGVFVAAALPCDAGLQVEPAGEGRLRLDVDACHGRSAAVVAFEHRFALFVGFGQVARGEDMVECGVEAFDEQVGLHAAEGAVEVDRGAEAVRTLLAQVGGELRDHAFAAHEGDVQVFVEGLRCAEAAGVVQPQVDLFGGVVAQVDARREDHVVDHVVVIEPAAEQKTPFAGLPLVLDHAAEDVYLLIRAHVVADRHVVDVVVAVLHAERQFGGEKQQPFEPLQELRAADDRQSVGAAVGFAGVFELFVGRAFACAAVVSFALNTAFLLPCSSYT